MFLVVLEEMVELPECMKKTDLGEKTQTQTLAFTCGQDPNNEIQQQAPASQTVSHFADMRCVKFDMLVFTRRVQGKREEFFPRREKHTVYVGVLHTRLV